MTAVDDYLATMTASQKAEFERIRGIVHDMVPGVEELISYGVPAFKDKKKFLIWVGGFKDHMSIFPASDSMIEVIGEELGKHRTSKGTIQFSEEKPISEAIIRQIIAHRLDAPK